MPAEYPGAIYSPRTKSNKDGVTYEPTEPTKIFAEDINYSDQEVVAIETILGINPNATFDSVDLRIADAEGRITTLEETPGGIGEIIALKTADQQIINTTTYQNITDLVIEAEANSVYVVKATIIYYVTSADDSQLRMTLPTGATGIYWHTANSLGQGGSSITGGLSNVVNVNSVVRAELLIYIVIGSTAGNIQLQMAPLNNGNTGIIVYKGSHLIAIKV